MDFLAQLERGRTLARPPLAVNPYELAAQQGMDISEFGKQAVYTPHWAAERHSVELSMAAQKPDPPSHLKVDLFMNSLDGPLYSSFAADRVYREDNLKTNRVARDRLERSTPRQVWEHPALLLRPATAWGSGGAHRWTGSGKLAKQQGSLLPALATVMLHSTAGEPTIGRTTTASHTMSVSDSQQRLQRSSMAASGVRTGGLNRAVGKGAL